MSVPLYPWNKRLDRPQRRSGFFELEKNSLSLPGIEALLLCRPYRNLFTIPTELTPLCLSQITLKNWINRLLRHVESSRKYYFNNVNHECCTDSRPLRQRTECQQHFGRFCYHYCSVHSFWYHVQNATRQVSLLLLQEYPLTLVSYEPKRFYTEGPNSYPVRYNYIITGGEWIERCAFSNRYIWMLDPLTSETFR